MLGRHRADHVRWTPGGATTSSITVSPTATTTYTVTATDAAGATQTGTVAITVNPALACSVSPAAKTIDTGQSVTMTATCTGGTSPDTYSWSPGGATTSSITVSPTANDDLHGHGDGCDRRDGDGFVGDHGERGDCRARCRRRRRRSTRVSR